MARHDLFDTYPHDTRHMQEYIAYQQRYVAKIRESDRVILGMVAAVLRDRHDAAPAAVLDIGCSTGNLLRHLKQAFPSLALTGGDLSDLQLDTCRKDPDLAGIAFTRLDIKALPADARYDAILANAILYGFDHDSFLQSLRSLSGALRPRGVLIAFDFFHPWQQEVEIIEKTRAFPHGHPLHFRSYRTTEAALREAGFGDVTFNPFAIPIDLPRPDQEAADIRTHTVETTAGERLQFRGVICQPWCHLRAVKPSRSLSR
jgi:SAM-dependent methyltransferase